MSQHDGRGSAFGWFRGWAAASVLLSAPVITFAYLSPWDAFSTAGVDLVEAGVRPFPAFEVPSPVRSRPELKARGQFLVRAEDTDAFARMLADVFKEAGLTFRTVTRQLPDGMVTRMTTNLELYVDSNTWQSLALDLTSISTGMMDWLQIAPTSPFPAIGPHLMARSLFSQLWLITDEGTSPGTEFPTPPSPFFAGTAALPIVSGTLQPTRAFVDNSGGGGGGGNRLLVTATFGGDTTTGGEVSPSNLSSNVRVR